MIPAHGIYFGKRPNFRRDDLMNLGNINKNDLPRILRKYAKADNVSTYLNRLRVEYAVKQMKSKPFLSFDAIAKLSGFLQSVQHDTFTIHESAGRLKRGKYAVRGVGC